MIEDHIGVKINGVTYVKLDDVIPMRARIEELEKELQTVSMWKLREQLGADKSRYGVPTNEHFYDHVVIGLREEAARDPRVWSKNLAEDAADYIEGLQYQLRCDYSWKHWAERYRDALKDIRSLYVGEEICEGVFVRDNVFKRLQKIEQIVDQTIGED